MNIEAMAATSPGAELTPFSYRRPPLCVHDVLIRVSHCGICHSDIHMIDNDWSMSNYPLVPGHEVVGEVVEVGEGVRNLKEGDVVGVGWQRSSCLACRDCLGGNENLCDHARGVISHGYGGFATHMAMNAGFCFPIPVGIDREAAGPLLCGGITVYSAMRHAGLKSGGRVGVIGLGGLGHMAVQFAAKLANEVVVFTTSPDKAEEAHRLGAGEVVLTAQRETPVSLREPLDLIVSTVAHNLPWDQYVNLLAADGTLAFVGAVAEPISLSFWPLLAKRRRILASPIGGRAMIREMLDVADRFQVLPLVETFPLAEANRALERVRSNRVRFRAVLKV